MASGIKARPSIGPSDAGPIFGRALRAKVGLSLSAPPFGLRSGVPRSPRWTGTVATAIATLSWIAAGPALATEAAVELPPVEVIEDGESPAPAPTVVEDPTGFGTVIEKKELEGRHLRAADVLLRAPGTTVRHDPGAETVRVRGGSPEHVLVFLDGIRLNPASGGGVDLRTLPPALLERVTLLRGNEGARYGAGAFGGVVLLETRATGPGEGGVAAAFTAGSFGTFGFDGSAAGGGDTYDGLAAVSLYRTAGDYPAAYDPTPSLDGGDLRDRRVDNNDDRQGALLLKGGARWGDLRLTALAQGTLAERGLPGTFYRPTPDRRRSDRRLLGALRARGEPSADLALEAGLELRHDGLLVEDDAPVPGADATPTAGGDPWQTEGRALASSAIEGTPVDWALLRADLEAGDEWLESPYHGAPSRALFAAAASAELYAGKRITVAPAARFDVVGPYASVSPKLGVAYRPVSLLELRASGARTFRPPSFGELYLDQGPMKPNPDLKSERGWAVDGGAVLRWKAVEVQGSAFLARSEDLIVYELVSGTVAKPFNFADAEVAGGELEATVRPLRGLTLAASWTRAVSRNLRDDPRYLDHDLPYHPRDRVQGRAAWDGGGATAYVEGSRQSAQFTNRENTSSLPAQTTFGTGAGVRLAKAPWELWLSGQVDNVFDATLVDQLGFPQPGRAFFAMLRAGPPDTAGAGDTDHPSEPPVTQETR
jgi:outer membrane receptor protein involved in Fe transport